MSIAGTTWMTDASCRDLPPATFFPDDGGGVEVAKRVCARCPVRQQCLEFALSHHIAHGVWGGMSERARQRLAAARRASAPGSHTGGDARRGVLIRPGGRSPTL